MATNIIFTRGNTATINATAITDGQILYNTTEGTQYLDNGTIRLRVGQNITVDAMLNSSSNNPISNRGVAGVMHTSLSEISTITQAGNIPDALAVKELNSKMLGIKTYVGEDKLLHFVDSTGADSALNFSSIKVRHLVTCSSNGQTGTWYWYRKLLPSPEVNICSGNGTTVNNYTTPSNINLGPILFVTRDGATGVWTLKNRLNYPLTVTPNGGTAFTVAAGANFTNFTDNAVFTAEYVSQNLDELRDICTNITF